MVGLTEKVQRAANAMRKGHCIIHLWSRGYCKPPADSRQNSGGVKGQSPRKPQDPYIYETRKGAKSLHFPSVLQYKNLFSRLCHRPPVKESVFQDFSFLQKLL